MRNTVAADRPERAKDRTHPRARARLRRPDRALVPALVVFAGLALVPPLAVLGPEAYVLNVAMRVMILAIAVISLDLLIGHGGLVSFGHAAFIGIGAYTTGIMVTEGLDDLLVIVPTAILLAAVFALATGAVALRTTGVYFIMITLAFGQMLYFTAGSLSAYGGDDGLTLWNTATLAGSDVLDDPRVLFYATLAVLVSAFVVVDTVARSRFGRVLKAAKDNAVRTSSLGFDVARYRLAAYVLAGVIAALAGVLSALHAEFVSPAAMSWHRSGELIVMVVLGGMGARSGALLGAIAFVGLEEGLSTWFDHWKLIFGPMLVLVVLYAKGGLASLLPKGRHEQRRD